MTIKHWILGDMEKAEKLTEMVHNFFSSAVNDMKKYKIDVIGVDSLGVFRLQSYRIVGKAFSSPGFRSVGSKFGSNQWT